MCVSSPEADAKVLTRTNGSQLNIEVSLTVWIFPPSEFILPLLPPVPDQVGVPESQRAPNAASIPYKPKNIYLAHPSLTLEDTKSEPFPSGL